MRTGIDLEVEVLGRGAEADGGKVLAPHVEVAGEVDGLTDLGRPPGEERGLPPPERQHRLRVGQFDGKQERQQTHGKHTRPVHRLQEGGEETTAGRLPAGWPQADGNIPPSTNWHFLG